jgi:hypothetical protein
VEEHACTFNYKELERGHLERANQRVVADKLDRL